MKTTLLYVNKLMDPDPKRYSEQIESLELRRAFDLAKQQGLDLIAGENTGKRGSCRLRLRPAGKGSLKASLLS